MNKRSYITNCLIISRGEVLFGTDDDGRWFVNLDDYVILPREQYAATIADEFLPICPWPRNEYTRTLRQLDDLAETSKVVADTGGGCSVCGATPCVNVTGTYWLCGPCVLEYHGEPK